MDIKKLVFMATIPRGTFCCFDCEFVEKVYRESEVSIFCVYNSEGVEKLPNHCQLIKKPYLQGGK